VIMRGKLDTRMVDSTEGLISENANSMVGEADWSEASSMSVRGDRDEGSVKGETSLSEDFGVAIRSESTNRMMIGCKAPSRSLPLRSMMAGGGRGESEVEEQEFVVFSNLFGIARPSDTSDSNLGMVTVR
jgi:hypothetical protein